MLHQWGDRKSGASTQTQQLPELPGVFSPLDFLFHALSKRLWWKSLGLGNPQSCSLSKHFPNSSTECVWILLFLILDLLICSSGVMERTQCNVGARCEGIWPRCWSQFPSWGGLGAAFMVSSLTFSSPNSTGGFVSFPSLMGWAAGQGVPGVLPFGWRETSSCVLGSSFQKWFESGQFNAYLDLFSLPASLRRKPAGQEGIGAGEGGALLATFHQTWIWEWDNWGFSLFSCQAAAGCVADGEERCGWEGLNDGLVQCHGKEMVFKGRKLKSPIFRSK